MLLPSETKFHHRVAIPEGKVDEIRRYLETNVGPRLYYLQSQMGGKKWLIRNDREPGKRTVEVADSEHATYIALKF